MIELELAWTGLTYELGVFLSAPQLTQARQQLTRANLANRPRAENELNSAARAMLGWAG